MPATASTSTPPRPIAALPEIVELNIGHFLVGEAIFSGLADSDARRCAPRWTRPARAGRRMSAR